MKKKNAGPLFANHLILSGIGVWILYWIVDSMIDVVLLQEGSLIDRIWIPDAETTWRRLFIGFVIILFSVSGAITATRRRQAEEVLRESEERFRQLTENIREVFWLTDPNKNQMIYISPGYEEIWGRPCESLYRSPRSWTDAIHLEDRNRVIEAALTKQIRGTYDEEYRIVRPDGSIRWIQDRAFPIRNESGEVDRIAGIAEDITEKKRTEKALRESEARCAGILEIATDAIIAVDQTQCITLFNKGAERIFGYEASEVIGQPLDLWLLRTMRFQNPC